MGDFAIISHPDCALHDAGPNHPERPQRVIAIEKALKQFRFSTQPEFYLAQIATREQLALAHSEDHIDTIFNAAPKTGMFAIDADTHMNPHTLNAALLAAGAVCKAVDLVMTDKANVVFCNVRPPGHHAEREQAMGFCFFNNVAIGVNYAIKHYQLQRIAIVDFDVHHGNGTQNIFQQEPRVMLCSSFQYPFYPGYQPENDNDHIISIPLPAGTNGGEYREVVQQIWFDKIRAFKPELIFFSAGFDAHTNDPLANINLTKEDYEWISKEVAKIARETCKGKMISVLEGGYDLDALSECVPAHLQALLKP